MVFRVRDWVITNHIEREGNFNSIKEPDKLIIIREGKENEGRKKEVNRKLAEPENTRGEKSASLG